jgi:hypothetical protein
MKSSILPMRLMRAAQQGQDVRSAVIFAVVFILAGYYAIFRLPFRFPPTRKMVSPSFVFGVNNSVAIASVVLLIGVATLFLLWRRHRVHAPVSKWFSAKKVPVADRVRWGVFALMALAHSVVVAIMWANAQVSSTWRMDFEASHFLWRLHLMELLGARPYLDFQHEYGPAMLYVPAFLHRILSPAGVSLEAAYYVAYLACNLLGLWAILLILNHALIPRR